MRRTWLRWFRSRRREPGRWWKIDALTLGPGLFFVYATWRRFPDSSSFLDAMLPNFASELMGVWLGVRIIDYLISNQEEYHRVRRNILNLIESSMELSRKILIKYDVVFLEEFQSRRAIAERVYEKKQKWFSAEELEEFATWIEQGVVFEVAGRRYFQQVSDLQAIENSLPGHLGEFTDRITLHMPNRQASSEVTTGTSAARIVHEPWFLKIANALTDFVHNAGRPIIAEPVSIRALCQEARRRIKLLDPAVQQILERYFAEIDTMMDLRIEFNDAFKRFNLSSKILTANILEETEE